jgi:hypothetical protein
MPLVVGFLNFGSEYRWNKMANDLMKKEKPVADKKPNIFLTILLTLVGFILILLGVMRGDPGRFVGGDTPLLTLVQVVGGLYVLYWVYLYWKGK